MTSPRPDPVVRIGQLWADNDKREWHLQHRQRLRVVGIDIPSGQVLLRDEDTGRQGWVLLRRMKPNSTGYCLVQESENESDVTPT